MIANTDYRLEEYEDSREQISLKDNEVSWEKGIEFGLEGSVQEKLPSVLALKRTLQEKKTGVTRFFQK